MDTAHARSGMSAMADNPAEVVSTLDSQLDHEISLVLFDRGALCLGYSNPPQEYFTTQDVDGIIRMSQLESLVNDDSFWMPWIGQTCCLNPRGST